MPDEEYWVPVGIDDFLAEDEPDYLWVVEGLIEQRDRVILTGREGKGKSTLCQQFGMMLAAGIHPFTGEVIEAKSVLLIDLENSRRQLRRRLAPLRGLLAGRESRFWVMCAPAGLDLTSERDVMEVHTALALSKPDLLMIGPMYKMGPDLTTEAVSLTVSRRLDQWRERFGCALLIESHQPHEVVSNEGRFRPERPFGCYAEDTEVLTRYGWKLHADVAAGDLVMAYDVQTSTTRWEPVEATHNYPYIGDMVNVHHRSLRMLVTPNHRMVTGTRFRWPDGRRAFEFREAGAMVSQGPGCEVPYAQPCEDFGADADLDLMQYLGWWIAEGCLNDWGPVLTQVVGPLAEEMKANVTRMGYEYNEWVGGRSTEQPCMQLRLRGAIDFGHWLHDEVGEGAANKRIPTFVWDSDAMARRTLLIALMQGDGNHDWTPEASLGVYCTTSKGLADDVQFLAISLGYAARVKIDPPDKAHHKVRYYVEIHARATLGLKGYTRTLEHYEGNVVCLTVPSGAYVTRREGYMAIAGNSSLWMRWPEFGICLEDNGTLRHWRGQREERDWPEKLHWGQTWPWEAGVAKCIQCGEALSDGQNRYCSERCGNAWRQARRRARVRGAAE